MVNKRRDESWAEQQARSEENERKQDEAVREADDAADAMVKESIEKHGA
jgi:fructose-1,6-bisphosphatase/inositol monophosphatase family enzyme